MCVEKDSERSLKTYVKHVWDLKTTSLKKNSFVTP
jgi:hypothetical protein